ncbi:MAG: hypothetical protein ACR2NX_02770 [Chthoniobacterales bacterium]
MKDPRPLYILQRGLLEGIALRRLGREEEARASFLKAKETGEAALREAPNDANRQANLSRALADVYAIVGENGKVIALFDTLLSQRSDVTVPLLKFDPVLDQLRLDPKFQEVQAKCTRKH